MNLDTRKHSPIGRPDGFSREAITYTRAMSYAISVLDLAKQRWESLSSSLQATPDSTGVGGASVEMSPGAIGPQFVSTSATRINLSSRIRSGAGARLTWYNYQFVLDAFDAK